jgi:hypothetical protein
VTGRGLWRRAAGTLLALAMAALPAVLLGPGSARAEGASSPL